MVDEMVIMILEQIHKRQCVDLKPSLIDLEACSKATGRKQNHYIIDLGSVRD